MKNVEIEIKLRKIHEQKYSLEEFNADLQVIKGIYVKENKQEEAKQIWIYQTIIKVHKLFIEAFNLLKSKQYYQGWCQLERIEITIRDLKKHFLYDKEQYKLWQIEKTKFVKHLNSLLNIINKQTSLFENINLPLCGYGLMCISNSHK